MRMIKIVFIYLLSISVVYGYLEVPEEVKTPSEVAAQIKEFLNSHLNLQEDIHLTDEQRVALIERAHKGKQLLIDAYVIYHMCHESLACDQALVDWFEKGTGKMPESVNKIHDIIKMYQGDTPVGEAVTALYYEEFSIIRADCLCNCKDVQKKLQVKIPLLYQECKNIRERLSKK